MLLVWQVVVDDDSHVPAKIEYQAESPDEKALVEAARDFGTSHHACCIALGRLVAVDPQLVDDGKGTVPLL
jgi:magnesium-transporting ATPase (P-type)